MKKRRKAKQHNSVTTFRSLPAVVALAVALLAIGAVSAVSRQLVAANQASQKASTDATSKKYITARVAGQDVQIDSQTRQIKPLTPEEAQQLADKLKVMLNKSTDDLVEAQHEDGSVSMDLKGRFQNVTVARVNEDGTVSQSCVDNPRAAASFFRIDPKLLGVEGPVNDSTRPAPTTPVKNKVQ